MGKREVIMMNEKMRKPEKGENRPKRIKPGHMGKLLVEGCAGIRERIKKAVLLPKEKAPREVSMLNYMLGRDDVGLAQHLIENGAVVMTGMGTPEIPDFPREKRVKMGSKEADDKMQFMIIDGNEDIFSLNMLNGPYKVSEDKNKPMLVGYLNFHRGFDGKLKFTDVLLRKPSHLDSVTFAIELTKGGKTADMLRKAPIGYSFRRDEVVGKVEAIEKALDTEDMEKVRELLEAEKPEPWPAFARETPFMRGSI